MITTKNAKRNTESTEEVLCAFVSLDSSIYESPFTAWAQRPFGYKVDLNLSSHGAAKD